MNNRKSSTHPLHANGRPTGLLAALAVLFAIGLLANHRGAAAPARASAQRLTSQPRPKAPAAKTVSVGEEIHTRAGQRRRVMLPDGSILFVNQNTTVTLDTARRLTLAAGEVLLDV